METVALLIMCLFGLLNLWVFRRFQKPLLPLLAVLFLAFFLFFLAPVYGLLAFLLGQALVFYWVGKRG